MAAGVLNRRALLLALLLGLIPGTVLALTSPSVPPKATRVDPAASMSEAEQIRAHEQGWTEFRARYEDWLTEGAGSQPDLRQLPRVSMNVIVGAGPATIEAAVDQADEIVVGRVETVEFLPEAVTVVHFRVLQVVKGTPPATIDIIQAGGPMPANQDWTGVVLAQADADPLLLPNDEAVLLLASATGTRQILPFAGQYRIAAGIVKAGHGEVGGVLFGRAVDDVLAILAALVRQSD